MESVKLGAVDEMFEVTNVINRSRRPDKCLYGLSGKRRFSFVAKGYLKSQRRTVRSPTA